MTLLLRPARPEDAEAAVPLIFSSGPAAFSYVFGEKTAEFLRHAFIQGGGEMGHRCHVVGEVEGRVVAAGALLDGKMTLAYTLAAAKQIFGFYRVWAGLGVIRRGLAVEAVIRPPKRGEQCLVHLGVRPDLRGQGLGRQLIAALLHKARGTVAALDVAATNPEAERLYASLGFERVDLRKSRLGAVPDHWRMKLPL